MPPLNPPLHLSKAHGLPAVGFLYPAEGRYSGIAPIGVNPSRCKAATVVALLRYLRVLYTDRRGINLRNDVCHGMLATDGFGIGLADRVFHTLVMLSQVRRKDNGKQRETTSN